MSTFVASSLITSSVIELQSSEQSLTWTSEVIINTKVIGDVQISPDNDAVLFVASEPNMTEEKGVMLSRIYKSSVSGRSAVPFSSPEASSTTPRWSPDGAWISFLSTRNGSRNLYVIPSEGGEARALTKGTKDILTYAWSPDASKIAFIISDETEKEKVRKKTSLAVEYGEETTVNRLCVVDVHYSGAVPLPLTGDDFCVRGGGDIASSNVEFDWSPDSRQIVFAYAPTAGYDHYHIDGSIAIVDLATRSILPWEKHARYEAMPRYSPDGKWIGYLSDDSQEKTAVHRRLTVRAADGSQHRLLSLTPNEGPLLMGPNFLGWSQDGRQLLFFEPNRTKYRISMVPFNGGPAQDLDIGQMFIKEPVLSYDKSMLGFVAQAPDAPPEAFTANISDMEPIQVSALNERLLDYPKTNTKTVTWKSTDGLEIEGLLTYPIAYEEGKQYPLLLVIHGGPMAFFDETFLGTPNPYPLAAFAQAGFFILRPNPRGSTGYGKEFRNAVYFDWGGMDFTDLMMGVDMLVGQGIVDNDHLGVLGWSYGGYMTGRVITQTGRFKAASMGAGLANLISMNGTTDLHSFFTDYLGSFGAESDLYEDRSAIYHVNNITTPCLIQHGTADLRVPVSQAYEFYHALKREGKTVRLIVYPGMGHRFTDPKMHLDLMKSNFEWFKQHLLD